MEINSNLACLLIKRVKTNLNIMANIESRDEQAFQFRPLLLASIGIGLSLVGDQREDQSELYG